MCNNTIKITSYCIITRKATKGIKNIIKTVDGLGLHKIVHSVVFLRPYTTKQDFANFEINAKRETDRA